MEDLKVHDFKTYYKTYYKAIKRVSRDVSTA